VTSTHVFPGARTYVLPEIRSGIFRDIATKTFHFALIATAFVFVSILITRIHP
jgi:hypothetical protein